MQRSVITWHATSTTSPTKAEQLSRKTPCPQTIKATYDVLTATTAEGRFTAAMECAAALVEKTHAQAERILEIESSMDGQTVLTKATEYTASTVSAGGKNNNLKELREMMNQLKALVTAQGGTLAALSVKIYSGDGGGKKKDRNEESATRLARVRVLQEGRISQGRKLFEVSGQ